MTMEALRPLALILKQIAILHSCQVNIVSIAPASDKQPLDGHGSSQAPNVDAKVDNSPPDIQLLGGYHILLCEIHANNRSRHKYQKTELFLWTTKARGKHCTVGFELCLGSISQACRSSIHYICMYCLSVFSNITHRHRTLLSIKRVLLKYASCF